MNAKDHWWQGLGRFNTGLSFFDRFLQILQFAFVSGGGIGAVILSKTDPVLKSLGWIYWLALGLLAGAICAGIVWMLRSAALNQAKAAYYASLSAPKSLVNPLAESFVDMIIPVEDLRLPDQQIHKGKHFKRCKLVGPGAIAIVGGTFRSTGFSESGHLLALPQGTVLTGVLLLEDCTVEDCLFIRVTMLTDVNNAKAFAKIPGVVVKGISG